MANTLCLVGIMYLIGNALSDTKILNNLSLHEPAGSSLNEIVSLNNPGRATEELVKEGNITITFEPTNLTPHRYKLVVQYRADKAGYIARYTFSKLPVFSAETRLGANALKSAAG